jgi:hypothetical protein
MLLKYSMFVSDRCIFMQLFKPIPMCAVHTANGEVILQIFDRLNPLGVCVSYGTSLTVLNVIGNNYESQLREALEQGKKFRVVADNINWHSEVRDQRAGGPRSHLTNAFGSAAVIQSVDFPELDSIRPSFQATSSLDHLLLQDEDFNNIQRLYYVLVSAVAKEHIAVFDILDLDNTCIASHAAKLGRMSTVIPLPVHLLDEMKYDDMIKYMDWLESLLHKIAPTATPNCHIGGDQLTRERMSGAKRLRAERLSASCTAESKFVHLTPITSEPFHLCMKVLSYLYKVLFNKDSMDQIGSMANAKERLSRTNVHENVKQHYDADKDFAISFTNAFIIEALLTYMGLESDVSSPSDFPADGSDQEKKQWAKRTLTSFIDTCILAPIKLLSAVGDGEWRPS